MINYNPLYKKNQMFYGSNENTIIITGWFPSKNIKNQLEQEDYAGIGQLYSSSRGINFLLANLLKNPQIRNLLILSATKEDEWRNASKCLKDFFQNGFFKSTNESGLDCWVIRSDIPGFIDSIFPKESLEKLRENLKVYYFTKKKLLIEKAKKLKEEKEERWGEGEEIYFEEQEPTIYPGPRYGHRIEGKTVAETWVKIIHRIKTNGTIRPTGYDGKWQELIDLQAVVTEEPREFYFPEPNYLPVNRNFISEYIPQILNDAPYQEGVKYTYGQRLRSWFGYDQVEQVIKKLIDEIDAASAVMSLWDVRDHETGGSPCLNHIWVRVIDNELSLTATLRSNDMYAAWPANAMGIRALQQYICDRINQNSSYNLRLGPLITISQSAHIYDDCWEEADRLIQNQYHHIINNRDFNDPSGNFQIELENGQILVYRITPTTGDLVTTYQGTEPLKLLRELCADTPTLHPEHTGYLGIELNKAKFCLSHNIPYTQDQ